MEHPQWQSLIKLGNDCFHDQHWSQAEFFYREAYDFLAFGYQNNPLSTETLMAWVCTCHNLSSLYERINNVDLSLQFLKVPYEYLKEISESTTADEEVKLIALKGLSLAIPPLLSFAQKHPICDDCKIQLGAVAKLMYQDTPVVH